MMFILAVCSALLTAVAICLSDQLTPKSFRPGQFYAKDKQDFILNYNMVIAMPFDWVEFYSHTGFKGAALKCEVCSALNANSCSGHYETCKSPQSQCMVTLTESSVGPVIGGVWSAVLVKSCGSAYDCSHPATLTTMEFRVRVTTKCCDKDYCNNSTVDWKQPNSTLNGVTCESCFARNSATCDVKVPMNCSGDETNCVQYSASREGGSTITLAGCASESMQRSQGRAAFQGSSISVKGMQNRNGAESLRHNPFLLPSLAVITIRIFAQ